MGNVPQAKYTRDQKQMTTRAEEAALLESERLVIIDLMVLRPDANVKEIIDEVVKHFHSSPINNLTAFAEELVRKITVPLWIHLRLMKNPQARLSFVQVFW